MPLTDSDKNVLESFKMLTKGVANLFGSSCEVLVHSLENYDSSVIAIENGHNSGRAVGAPITDLALELINNNNGKQFLSPYTSKFSNGERCRSVTVPIKNGEKLIGLFCINLNIDISFTEFIKNFVVDCNNDNATDSIEIYSSSIDDMMTSLLQKNINAVMVDTAIPNQDKNKVIIKRLYKIGFFNLKGSIEALADKLQISIHTVYSNIRKSPDRLNSSDD